MRGSACHLRGRNHGLFHLGEKEITPPQKGYLDDHTHAGGFGGPSVSTFCKPLSHEIFLITSPFLAIVHPNSGSPVVIGEMCIQGLAQFLH